MPDVSSIKSLDGQTTYSIKDIAARAVMTGATSSAAGTSGRVPAPAAGDENKYLKGDGTWAEVSGGSSGIVSDIPFSVSVSDWAYVNGEYKADIISSIFSSTAYTSVIYDRSLREYATADIYDDKSTGRVSLHTDSIPTGTLTGMVRVFDGVVEGIDAMRGVANGVAALDATGKVPANQLPGYVDDVLEFSSVSAFPAEGEGGKIYVALDNNQSYRWSGSTYVRLSTYDVATQSSSGLMSAADKTKLDNIGASVQDKPFSIATTAWTLVSNEYKVEISDQVITVDCLVDVIYDRTLKAYAQSDIYSEKTAGKVTFYTDVIPTGTITGVIRIFDGSVEAIGEAKADKVQNATNGNLAGLNSSGNLVDSGKTLGLSIPAPESGDTDKFLKGNGTWAQVTTDVFTGATAQAAGSSGLVPAPAIADKDKYLKGSGEWAVLDIPEGSTALSLTATALGWTGEEAPYTQTVSATGVTTTNTIIVGMSGSFTTEQKEAIEQANILCTAQGTNSITLTAYGSKPEIDVPFGLVILG